MISVSVFPFPPESSLSYICMVVVPMGRCRLFVVVLVPPIVLTVTFLYLSGPSILLSHVDCIV